MKKKISKIKTTNGEIKQQFEPARAWLKTSDIKRCNDRLQQTLFFLLPKSNWYFLASIFYAGLVLFFLSHYMCLCDCNSLDQSICLLFWQFLLCDQTYPSPFAAMKLDISLLRDESAVISHNILVLRLDNPLLICIHFICLVKARIHLQCRKPFQSAKERTFFFSYAMHIINYYLPGLNHWICQLLFIVHNARVKYSKWNQRAYLSKSLAACNAEMNCIELQNNELLNARV